MKPYLNKKKASRKRTIVLLVSLLIVILGAVGLQAFRNRRSNQQAATNNTGETINYGPATEERENQSEQHKEDLANQPTPTPAGDKKNVTPVITDAGQYDDKVEVRAYIPGIIENGGKCTLTFKKDSTQKTLTVDAQAGPQATQCEPTGIPVSDFSSKGTWTLTVSYSSSSSSGTSDPWQVEVK